MKRRKEKFTDFFSEADKVMSRESVAKANAKAKKMLLNLELAKLRKDLGINQTEVKGFGQTSISRIENREDLKVSTLVDYCHALGVELEIVARSKNGRTRKLLKAS